MFESLVLSGGGSKGLYTLGALRYADENKYLDTVNNYIGTSIGSVIVLLLVCGYKPIEIFQYIYMKENFLDINQIIDVDIFQIHVKWGLAKSDKFISKIETMVREKYKDKTSILYKFSDENRLPTLLELYNLTKKNLIICVSNVSKMVEEYFSYKTEPNLVCTEAIKMSCSLPMVFHKEEYKDCLYVDGGLVDNFPILHPDVVNTKTLAIYLSLDYSKNIISLQDYLIRIVSLSAFQLSKYNMNHANKNCKIINIFTKDDSLLKISMSSKDKMDMFVSGYDSTRSQFGANNV